MTWEKLGLIFKPPKCYEWMNSHAQVPFTVNMGHVIRVFFSTRSKKDENNDYSNTINSYSKTASLIHVEQSGDGDTVKLNFDIVLNKERNDELDRLRRKRTPTIHTRHSSCLVGRNLATNLAGIVKSEAYARSTHRYVSA